MYLLGPVAGIVFLLALWVIMMAAFAGVSSIALRQDLRSLPVGRFEALLIGAFITGAFFVIWSVVAMLIAQGLSRLDGRNSALLPAVGILIAVVGWVFSVATWTSPATRRIARLRADYRMRVRAVKPDRRRLVFLA